MEKKINLLDTVPVCGLHLITEWKDECVVLAFPRFKKEWMRRYLVPKGMSGYIRVTLEERGSAIWRLIDGKRTVGEIVLLLSQLFPDEDCLALRTTTYIQQLQKDRFITLQAVVKVEE